MELTDGGAWRGPTLETWVARIAAPILREGETLPLIKPFPGAPEEEAGAAMGGGAVASPGVRRPAALPDWIEAELRELYGK